MASFFSKFIRGGAATGGALYADIARQELRAGIMTERDKVLNDNRLSLEKQRQEFQTAKHKETLALSESQYQRNLESPRAKTDKINLDSAKKLEALKIEYNKAESAEDRTNIARKMAAEQGKPIESRPGTTSGPTAAMKEAKVLVSLDEFPDEASALRFLKSKEGNMTREIFKAILSKQEDDLLSPDDPNYLSFEEALTKARDMAKPSDAMGGDEKAQHENNTKYPSIKTQAEFDKLPSGALYFDVFDGKSYRKP